MTALEVLAERQTVGRLAGPLAVEVAFAAADLGAQGRGRPPARRSAIVRAVLQRLEVDPRELTPLERAAAAGLCTLAHDIGRARRV